HEKFISTPWKGIHLISPAFFVSNPEDHKLFNIKTEKELFSNIHHALIEKELNLNAIDTQGGKIGSVEIYVSNYTEIANHTIFPEAMKLSPEDMTRNDKIVFIEKTTLNMLPKLVKANLMEWSKLNVRNFIQGFRDDKILIILIIVLLFSLFKLFKKQNSLIYRLLFIFSFLGIANMGIVAIGIYTTPRYTFYNYWILPFIVIILLNEFNSKSIKEP
ncbi:MAG: hypothetical protein AAF688_15835, partial [Bacteroidota bacterium]